MSSNRCNYIDYGGEDHQAAAKDVTSQ